MEWFDEEIHKEFQQRLRVDTALFEAQTKYQSLKIFENSLLGKVMLLDDAVQVTSFDEFFYHEMFAHVPLFSLDNAKSVLIIGGGDGCLLRETLKHPEVRTTMVEIDGDVVEATKEYMPDLAQGAFEDERATLIIGNGLKFVEETQEKFDVLLIDSTDPDDISEPLFTEAFLMNAQSKLNEGGILVMQSGTPAFQEDVYKLAKISFKNVFQNSGFFYSTIPTYSGGQHAFAWGSSKDIAQISEDEITNRYTPLSPDFHMKHYNSKVHVASFAESTYLSQL